MTKERSRVRSQGHKQEMNEVEPQRDRIAFLQWLDGYVMFDPKGGHHEKADHVGKEIWKLPH